MENEFTYDTTHLNDYILENTPQRIRNRYAQLARYAVEHNFGVLDEDVVVIDTETTGFSFNHDELIQIAAARMQNGVIVGWYNTFVNPGQPIPDDVKFLTHITDEMVVDAPNADQALCGLVEFVGNTPLVAHNANFDCTFTTKRESGATLKENIWIDSLDLARIALPRFKSHRLLDLIRAFGGPESTHRADDDVTATCLVYRVLLAAVQSMPPELVKYIAEMSSVESWNTAYVFKCLALDEAPTYNVRKARFAAISLPSADIRHDAFKPRAAEEQNNAIADNVSRETLMPSAEANGTETDDGGVIPQDSASDETHSEPESNVASSLVFATDEEIETAFSPEGLVGSLYENYEMREEQKLMALSVNSALASGRNLVVEAGTGVGKSMAYLVPLALAAQKNNITVGVATKTNALLDQLINKELPLLNEALGVSATSLKGFTHYPCMRKVERLAWNGPTIVPYKGQFLQQAPSLAGLLSYIEQTEYDDMDGLKIDYRAMPRYTITTKSTECLRRKCPFYGRSCFVHGAREEASRSDIVVTNHSLLFWDVRFEGGLLPPIRYWAIDEAHSAEQEARRAFSLSLSSDQLRSLAQRVSSDSAKTNVFLAAQRSKNQTSEAQALTDALITKARNAGGAFAIAAEEFTLRVKDLLYFNPQPKRSGYEYIDLWLNEDIRNSETFAGVAESAKAVHSTLDKLLKAARDLVAYFESIEETSPEQRAIALVALELREISEAIEIVFSSAADSQVRSVRLSTAKDRLNEVFTVQPLDVGEMLNTSLYQDTQSVVYTSATLTVDGSFDTFEKAMGLNKSDFSKTDYVQVESSYDFDTNMRIFIPEDMPEPQDAAYLSELEKFLYELHVAQEGSMLTLFTNRKEMEQCFDVVYPQLKEHNLRLICQKWGVSIKGLRDDFLKDEHLSLFALKSFWEGFDAPGATLKGVVIPKLPFGLPTDPLSCERSVIDRNAWSHYSLPAAVIDVKQAVGRLIRTANDEGIVVLADKRLLTKYYGKKFLNSLPSKNIQVLPMQEIIEQASRRQ